MKKRWKDLDCDVRHHLAECKRKKRGIQSPAEKSAAVAQSKVDAFNAQHPVGTAVWYWPWTKEGPGIESRTRSEAQLLGGHTAVVWVEGHASCISLTHVDAVQAEPQEVSDGR